MKLLIILPAFNEATVIIPVIRQLKAVGKTLPVDSQICVVNDGSTDKTAAVCEAEKVVVLSHLINCGLGASLATGLAYARRNNFDFAITIDSDGQHDPHDLIHLLKPLMKGKADVVIGSRMLVKNNQMPWLRQLNNHLFNWLTYFFFQVKTSDSLSGFRGFNRRAIQLIKLKTERMEVSNEFFLK